MMPLRAPTRHKDIIPTALRADRSAMSQERVLVPLMAGSRAQLNGELTEDFTCVSRAALLGLLNTALSNGSGDAQNIEPLVCLLVSTDAEIVLLALEVIASIVRSHKLAHDKQTSKILREFSRGWAGSNGPLDLESCIFGGDAEQARLASSLHFEFYHDGKLEVIQLGMEALRMDDCLALFNRLVCEFNVPMELRFALLTRIRFAKAFSSTAARQTYVRILILSLELIQWRKLMSKQLADVVVSGKDVPESIRVAALYALTAYGKRDIFTRANRERKVKEFLSGNSQHSSDFIQALLFNSSVAQLDGKDLGVASIDSVLAWLEDELEGPRDGRMIKSLLLSEALRAPGAVHGDQKARLERCLVKVFGNSKLFGGEVFDTAAGVLLSWGWSDQVKAAFTEAMVSEAIPSGWQITEAAVTYFLSRMTPGIQTKTVELIRRDVASVSDVVLLEALSQDSFTSLLIEAGGYEFLQQLPGYVLERPRRSAALNLSDSSYVEIARSLSSDFGKCAWHSERLARVVEWLLFDNNGVCNLSFLKQLYTHGALDKLLASLEGLGGWSSQAALPPLDAYFSTLKQLLENHSALVGVVVDESRLVHRILHAVVAVFRLCHGLATPEAAETLLLTVWKRCDCQERQRVLVSLLKELGRGGAAAATVVALLVTKDGGAAAFARARGGVARTVLELLESSASPSEDLLRILNRMFEARGDDDSGNPFTPTDLPEQSDELMARAVVWYGNSLRRRTTLCISELAKLGETLTRNHSIAQELLKAGDLAGLVDAILELVSADPCSKSYAFRTVVHLLEDRQMLYHSMVRKIWTYMKMTFDTKFDRSCKRKCDTGLFVTSFSSLAFREPDVFMQASFDTCEVDDENYMRLKDPDVYPDSNASAAASDVFTRLLDLLLDRLDDIALELLTEIVDEIPGTPQAVDAAIVERVLQSSVDAALVRKFVGALIRREKDSSITPALMSAFSSQPDTVKLVYLSRNVQCCFQYITIPVADCMLKALGGLDLDHPEAGAVAASIFGVLSGSRDGDDLPGPTFDEPKVSDDGVAAFLVNWRQMGAQSSSAAEESSIQDDGKMDDEEVDDEDEDWMSWKIGEDVLEILVKFLWLHPAHTGHCLLQLARLFKEHAPCAALSKALLGIVLRPGAMRSFGSRLWHRCSISGVPDFVLERMVYIHIRLVYRGYFLEEDNAVAFVPVLVNMLDKNRRLSKLAMKMLKIVVQHLHKTISIALSEAEVHKLCRTVLFTSERSSLDTLADLLVLNPTLSPAVASRLTSLSTEVGNGALESLERGNHSCNETVARLAQLFERLVDQQNVEAREHLVRTLDPLWRFVREAQNMRKTRPLVEAFFLTQALGSSSAPPDSAVTTLQSIAKRHPRYLKLALPMLRKWPCLLSLGLEFKLEFVRGSFTSCTKSTPRPRLPVTRDCILQDSRKGLAQLTPEVLRISRSVVLEFVDESRDDLGGLRREWFHLVSREIGEKLFTTVGDDRYQPYPSLSDSNLSDFKFVGQLVAKAIVDDERLDLRFTRAFYKHILGQEVTYKDMDEEFVKNITWLLKNNVDESIGLTFSVDIEHCTSGGKTELITCDLVAGGRDISVTDANKHDYVMLLGEYLMTKSIKPQLNAFLDGFYELIPIGLLSNLNADDLELLICGSSKIDVQDIKNVAKCKHHHHILKWFWTTIKGFSEKNKEMLFKFITGSPKVPFSGLNSFYIGYLEEENHYLPVANTCVNQILLPLYKSKEQLREKLLLAIYEGAERFGF